MTFAAWYWVFFVLYALFGGYWAFRPNGDRYWFGGHLIFVILLGILGWAVFGPVAK